MCLEDIRLGRKAVTAIKSFVIVPGTDTQLFGASKDRIGFRVGISSSNLSLAPTLGDGPSASGLLLNTTKPDFELTIEQHGDIVTQGWSARSTGGPTVTVIETYLADK